MLLRLKLQIAALILVFISVVGAGYLLYSKVKDIGYKEAEVKYELIIKEKQAAIDAKVKRIETLATTLLEENRSANASLSSDMATISSKVRGKVLTVVKEGKCIPTQTFSDTFNEMNKRVNQSLKETSK